MPGLFRIDTRRQFYASVWEPTEVALEMIAFPWTRWEEEEKPKLPFGTYFIQILLCSQTNFSPIVADLFLLNHRPFFSLAALLFDEFISAMIIYCAILCNCVIYS